MERNDTFDCTAVLERLPLFVGDDLEAADHRSVREHLAGCRGCRSAEARAREARERFRGAMDASMRGATRLDGLWPELRARLHEEGILGKPTAGSAAGTGTRDAAGRREPARLRRLPGLPALLASLTAVAAAVLALVAVGPLGPLGRLGEDASTPGVRVQGPVPVRPVAAQASGGLRRVAPGEDTLFREAEPLVVPGGLARPVRPALQDTALVHYR